MYLNRFLKTIAGLYFIACLYCHGPCSCWGTSELFLVFDYHEKAMNVSYRRLFVDICFYFSWTSTYE